MLSRSADETKALGQKIGKSLKGGEVLALIGDLGAGKTTFTQGLAESLGIEKVVSPSFIIMRSYPIINHPLSINHLYHVDLYRLEKNIKKELDNLGVTAIWGKPENVVLIEWADKAQGLLPKSTIYVKFEYQDEDKRKILLING